MEQAVVFTLLPQDVLKPGGDYQAAVFVSPRLTPDVPGTTAGDFTAFEDWPAVVAAARIVIQKQLGGEVEVRADGTALKPVLWRTYLAPIPVRGWAYHDLSGTEIRSFSAQAIHALARGLYTAVAAASGGDHPDPLAGGLRTLGAAYASLTEPRGGKSEQLIDTLLAQRDRAREATEARQRPFEPGGLAPQVTPLTPDQALASPQDAALNLAEARRFYDRPEARDSQANRRKYPRPDPAYTSPPVTKPEPDFHDVLGALADHPELLRALGIIVPITLPAAFVGGGGDFRVLMDHPALAGNPVTAQPWTRAEVHGDYFQPVSETGDLVRGLLPLDDLTRYDVAQVDIDSAALLVEQRVANVYPIAEAAGNEQPVTGDLPALRSTGLVVSRLRRAMILVQRIARSAQNAADIASGKEVVLFAEDIVRGFRVDVHDGTKWRSLMHRSVRYVDRSTGDDVFTVADQEAYLKASALTSTPDAAVNRAYLHEAIFGWDGWSLVMPRPGKHIRGTADDEAALADDSERFPGSLGLDARTGLILGTLPRLRYGGEYRFRARTVDLAGMSTPYAGDSPATAAKPFRRFQPVSHPAVVPRHAFTEGESALRAVVRSGVDADNSDPSSPVTPIEPPPYAATLNTGTPRTFGIFRPDSQRHLAPPKLAEAEAELLGHFDTAIGLPGSAANASATYRAAFARAQREQATFNDIAVLSETDPAASTPVVGIHLVPPLAQDGDFTQAAMDATLSALKRGQAPDPGFVVVHDTDTLVVPYLPDPLAAGTALRFTGGGTASGWTHTEVLGYAGAWPDPVPWRLVLAGGAAPDVAVAGGVITVTLPPGATATVRTSSSLADAAVLNLLGMWEWIASTVPPAQVPDVVAGAHQMITPEQTLTLVHATQRPLARPLLQAGFAAVRGLNDTFTHFTGVAHAQAASTGRLDVDGTWSEWFDDPASGQPPALVPGRTGHAFDLTLGPNQDDLALDSAVSGDLKHEFNDHKHRKIAYAVTATTRFREYFPPAVSSDAANLQVVGPAATIHVPNSARPPTPVIHSVIPTFRWEDLGDDPMDPLGRARTRVGGLRVWLERPWYPSGEDEMLGVVLSGADGIVAAEDLRRHYVSLWGKDPIRVNGELASAVPRPRDFTGTGLLQMDRLTLDETDSKHPGVTVVGHPLKYSPARDRWYADLEVDPGEAYWPFLRLGLTRFQPWSVTDAHLSKVVVVDFVQLTNRRTAAVTRPDPATVRVTVSGIEEWRYTPEMLPPPQAKAQKTRALPASAPDVAAAAFRGAGITASTAGIFSPPPTRGARAWVEQRGTTASDLDWHRVGDVIDLPRIDEDEVMRVWSGDVPLQVPLAAQRPGTDPGGAGSDWRLVTTEWESLPFDTAGGDGAMIERICYLDRFPL